MTVGSPFEVGNVLRRSGEKGSALHARLTSIVQKALYDLKPVAEAEHAKHVATLNKTK